MAKEKRSFYGTGRRKGSVAKVTLTPGTGKITVNGKSYSVKTSSKGFVSISVNLKPGTYKIVSSDPITGYKLTTTFKILSTIS